MPNQCQFTVQQEAVSKRDRTMKVESWGLALVSITHWLKGDVSMHEQSGFGNLRFVVPWLAGFSNAARRLQRRKLLNHGINVSIAKDLR